MAVPGFEQHSVYGSRTVFVYVPSTYRAEQPAPLFVALHGAAGNPTAAIGQASIFRGLWAGAAEAGGFILAAPVASGGQGGWIAPANETDIPSDYDVIHAVTERLAVDYRIDPGRRYLWGFSSGGHVTLDIALNRFHRNVNAEFFAGFGVSAGVSAGLACVGTNPQQCNTQVFGRGGTHRPIDIRIGEFDALFARSIDDRPRFLSNGWIDGVTFFWQTFAGGHTVLSEHPLQIWNNLCGFRNLTSKLPDENAAPSPRRVELQAIPQRYRHSPIKPLKDNLGLRPQDRKR